MKQEVGRIVSRTGARFVEAAVMASVPKLELKVPILICGEAAGEARRVLARYGMNLEDFGPEIYVFWIRSEQGIPNTDSLFDLI